jgi:sugar phosphate permease
MAKQNIVGSGENPMDQSDVRKVLRYRRLVFGVMASAYVLVYFHRQCPAVVAVDLQQTFHASAGLVGLMASSYFYPYACLQLPAGLLSDSLGPRMTTTLFLLVAVAGSILFGLAPNAGVAVAARVMVGIGVAMVFIPFMKLLSQWFRPGEFAMAASIVNVMGGVGVFLATGPLALLTEWIGWRASFQVIGLLTLMVAALVWTLVRNRPGDMGWPSIAETDGNAGGTVLSPREIPLREGVRRVITEPAFRPVAIWFTLTAGIFFSFAGLWAGPYLKHAYGLTKGEVGSVLGMTALGLILGSPFLSFLSDRVFKSRKKVLTLSAALLVLELIVLYSFPDGLSGWMLYLMVFFLCVFSASVVPVAFTTTKELFPIRMAGTSVGMVNLFPFLGGAVMQVLLGKVLDAYPRSRSGAYPLDAYSTILGILLLCAVAALACTFFMKETFPAAADPERES